MTESGASQYFIYFRGLNLGLCDFTTRMKTMLSAVVSPWRAGRRRSREQRGFPCASSSRHKSWLQKGKKERKENTGHNNQRNGGQ